MTTTVRNPHAPKALTDEQRALAADPESIRAAESVARILYRRARDHGARVDHDEFRACALLALCRVAQAFDPARGKSWKNWRYTQIGRALIDELRSLTGRRGRDKWASWGLTCSFGAVADDAGGCVPGELFVPAGECPVGWELEYEDEVHHRTRTLPDRDRAAVRMYLLRCGTILPDVAAVMGVSPSRASQVITDWKKRTSQTTRED
jgi:DNA-directed RNA polymerase specialized sigma24 family protein